MLLALLLKIKILHYFVKKKNTSEIIQKKTDRIQFFELYGIDR